ncbi:MAG: phosphoglycerate dehydrogenase [Anaerolineales bacterium]|nr:phosphoglycerate dehydrogenase [Anaerolineales bacterium]
MTKQLQDCRVLVTPTSYGVNDPSLRTQLEAEVGEVIYNSSGKPLSSSQIKEILPGVNGYIAGLDNIDRSALETADQLMVIARYGVGVDAVDVEAAREKNIIVTNTPGANSGSVAELTIGLMISLLRNIPGAVQATKTGEWPRMRGISLDGKVIGLVGFGAIGRHVAQRLKGFNCQVVAFDPVADEELAAKLDVDLLSLDELIGIADLLSLHCPVTSETRAMVDAAFLQKMKSGSYLINTARGELVNEKAMYSAIKSGKLRGAALDVFSQQPPEADNPLLGLPQVIATPHMGSHTDGAANAMGWGALNDCLAVLRGEEPLHRVI